MAFHTESTLVLLHIINLKIGWPNEMTDLVHMEKIKMKKTFDFIRLVNKQEIGKQSEKQGRGYFLQSVKLY